MWSKYSLLILFLSIGAVNSLTCNKDLMLDLMKHKLQKPPLPHQGVIDCLLHLSEEKITLSEAKFIWNSIIEFYSGISNIPEDTLATLHWVTIAIQPDDYENMTLGTLDVITNFGYYYGLRNGQLHAIADRIRVDFGAKQAEDYTGYDLTALRQILCVFNRSEIERIHPKAYKQASYTIGKLKNCDMEVLQGFATLAVDEKAYGPPHTWTKSTMKIVGIINLHLLKRDNDSELDAWK